MTAKVIALMSEPVSGDALRAAIGERANDADVLVVAPALNGEPRALPSDPLHAIEDALRTFPADEIVLFVHPRDERDWLKAGVVDEARKRFELPVTHVVINGR